MPAVSIRDLLPADPHELPCPDWAAVAERVRSLPDADQPGGWVDAVEQWTDALVRALGEPFTVTAGGGVRVVSPGGDTAAHLHAHARYCRRTLLDLFPGLARFTALADEVVLHLPHPDDYYTYIAAFYPDGEHGGSAGVHVRAGYPHTVACGSNLHAVGMTVAHELTHAALHHLDAPAWVEEGITQMVELYVAGSVGGAGAYQYTPRVELTPEQARRHRRFWPRAGLGPFWWGHGFGTAGGVQQLSYELAAVLMTLLVEEHRPGLFGFGRKKQQRFLDFLATAKAADAGVAAAEHLGYPLGELAAKFLGPGDWEPNPADADKLDLPTTE